MALHDDWSVENAPMANASDPCQEVESILIDQLLAGASRSKSRKAIPSSGKCAMDFDACDAGRVPSSFLQGVWGALDDDISSFAGAAAPPVAREEDDEMMLDFS